MGICFSIVFARSAARPAKPYQPSAIRRQRYKSTARSVEDIRKNVAVAIDWTDKIFINLIQPTGDFFTFVKCRLCPAGRFCGHSDLPSFLCSVWERCRTPPAYGRVIFARSFSFIINLCAARRAAGLLTLLVDENDIVASVSFDDLPYALGSA